MEWWWGDGGGVSSVSSDIVPSSRDRALAYAARVTTSVENARDRPAPHRARRVRRAPRPPAAVRSLGAPRGSELLRLLAARERDEPGALRAGRSGAGAGLPLDPHDKTGDHWHVLVTGLPPAFCYGWRVDGPGAAPGTLRPAPRPARPVLHRPVRRRRWGAPASATRGHRAPPQPLPPPAVQLARGRPPLTPLEDSIIYELHVRGFTCHPSGRRAPRHLRRADREDPVPEGLGVTAVELLPIHEFDECDCPFTNPDTGEQLRNFWGYNSIAFAAPKAAYAATRPGPRAGQRVPRDGQGASTRPASRSSSTSSSTTPARATTAAATYSLPRAGQRTLLPARRRTAST